MLVFCLAVSSGSETSTSLEQEKYFLAIVAATPLGNSEGPTCMTDSLTSLDSLLLTAAGCDPLTLPDTPDSIRRTLNPLSRAVSSLRSSGGRVKCKHALPTLACPTPPAALPTTSNLSNIFHFQGNKKKLRLNRFHISCIRDRLLFNLIIQSKLFILKQNITELWKSHKCTYQFIWCMQNMNGFKEKFPFDSPWKGFLEHTCNNCQMITSVKMVPQAELEPWITLWYQSISLGGVPVSWLSQRYKDGRWRGPPEAF